MTLYQVRHAHCVYNKLEAIMEAGALCLSAPKHNGKSGTGQVGQACFDRNVEVQEFGMYGQI